MSEGKFARPVVSIVIPVYNVAPYIEECAESLFNQTLKNIQYIFIDDASTDNSVEILEKVISQYPERAFRTTLIKHKENKGVSYTREEGVRQADGEWIIHCDADDVVDSEMYATLFNEAQARDSDILICGYRLFGKDIKDYYMRQGERGMSSQEMLEALMGVDKKGLHGSLCNKLIKRKYWDDISFNRATSFCEDKMTLVDILLKFPNLKIHTIPECFYGYRIRENSLTFRKDEKRTEEILSLIETTENLRDNNPQISENVFNAQIISLLYLFLRHGAPIKEFSKTYGKYQNKIKDNKILNKAEKLHLYFALKGNIPISKFVEECNSRAREIIKKRKYKKRRRKQQ